MYRHVFRSGQDPARHPTVILIHGLGGTLNIWDSIASVLERRFSVLRYDLRGHGRSDVPAGDWSLEDFVGDLEAIFIDECLSQAHLVGFSLGGLIVQQFALSYPERVGQLAILSAVAGRTDASPRLHLLTPKNIKIEKNYTADLTNDNNYDYFIYFII